MPLGENQVGQFILSEQHEVGPWQTGTGATRVAVVM